MEIIPAIDLIGGKCVRLSQGDYARSKTYNEQPLEVAKAFEAAGIKRLHLVDLDGAKAQHIVNYKVLEKLATHTNLIIDFGGGLKSDDDLRIAFESGASMVTGGSIAVKEPDTFLSWLAAYGYERIILGADVKEGQIAVSGWQETTQLNLNDFLRRYSDQGIRKVVCTDIACDGMLAGPSLALYQELLQTFPELYLIASGGVSSCADLDALAAIGMPAVIFGKAIYEGRIRLSDLTPYLL